MTQSTAKSTFTKAFIVGFKKVLRLGAIVALVVFLERIFRFGAGSAGDFFGRLMLMTGFLLPFLLLAALVSGLLFGWYSVWKFRKS